MSDKFLTSMKSLVAMLSAFGIFGLSPEEQISMAEALTAGFMALYSIITAVRVWLFK